MTLTQITYFETVCKYKNVTKAADALFVSRSAVSRAMKELESELGLVLFCRSRSGMELTEDGKMLREMFSEFNGAYNNLKKHMNDIRSMRTTPSLRIGISPSTGVRFFPDFFSAFTELYPDIHVQIIEFSTHECVDTIQNGDCDFFIAPHLPDILHHTDTMDYMKLYDSDMVLCTAANSPLAGCESINLCDISHLSRATLLSPLPMDVFGPTLLDNISANQEDNIVLQTSQQELIRLAVVSGFAATMMIPREMAEAWQGISIIPLDPPKDISVFLIWDRTIHTEIHENFLNFCKNYDFSKSDSVDKYNVIN